MPTPPFFLVKTRDRVLAVQAPGVNEIEEEVSATLLYFDFCCTIGIALLIHILFSLLNFTITSFWRFALSVPTNRVRVLAVTREKYIYC